MGPLKKWFSLCFARVTIVCCCFAGCGTADQLPGRVAIEVYVRVDGKAVGDGDLILRPTAGVKCPLITMPISKGVGRLPETEGPVPGVYRATFRPGQTQANLTEKLSKTGRVSPRAAGSVDASNETPLPEPELKPKGAMDVTVPSENPAFVAVTFPSA